MNKRQFEIFQDVYVDGIEGYIVAVYPNGRSPYIGKQHAYYWVRTPSLDYRERISWPRGDLVRVGRAVPFSEEYRIKPLNVGGECNE